jgi:hypothetical protein
MTSGLLPTSTSHKHLCEHIKYRFCSTCNIPVSRWNFTKLHRHDEEAVASPTSASGHQESSSKAKTKKNGRGTKSTKKNANAEALLAKLVERGAKEVQIDKGGRKGSPPKKNNSGEAKKRAEARRDQWEELLMIRPRSEESIVDWVQQVLALSDVDTDLDGQPAKSTEIAQEATGTKPKEMVFEKTLAKEGIAGESEKSMKSSDVSMEEKVSEQLNEKPADTKNGQKKETDQTGSADDDPREDKPTSSKNEDEEKVVSNSGAPVDSSEGRETPDVAPDGSENNIDYVSDEGSTSSEDSVDLRASKKLKTS